jgi:hypothetical protein
MHARSLYLSLVLRKMQASSASVNMTGLSLLVAAAWTPPRTALDCRGQKPAGGVRRRRGRP